MNYKKLAGKKISDRVFSGEREYNDMADDFAAKIESALKGVYGGEYFEQTTKKTYKVEYTAKFPIMYAYYEFGGNTGSTEVDNAISKLIEEAQSDVREKNPTLYDENPDVFDEEVEQELAYSYLEYTIGIEMNGDTTENYYTGEKKLYELDGFVVYAGVGVYWDYDCLGYDSLYESGEIAPKEVGGTWDWEVPEVEQELQNAVSALNF